MLQILRNLKDFIDRCLRGEDKVLIPRQLETIQKLYDCLTAGYRECLVVNPTGIGKTVIFSKLLEALLAGTNLRALVIGPTKIILRQNRWKLDAFGDIQAGAYFGTEKDLSKQVTVTTYHSLRNALKKGSMKGNEYDILILDEAHRALGEDTLAAIETFENAIKIGFTATPEFHEEKAVADLLPFTADEMSVREAIEASLLSSLKVFVFLTDTETSNLARSGRDYEEWALEKTINTTKRNRFIAQRYKDERFFGKRTVVYAAGRKHAQDLTTAFQAEGIVAGYVDGATSEDDREDLFLRFKEGTLPVLCNARVLIEGFDEPEAEVCFNAVPTMSKVDAEQRGGRILRRSRTRNRKTGFIVEFLDQFGQSDNTPVLFSEIAGAAEILTPEDRAEERKKQIGKKTKIPTARKPKAEDIIEDNKVIMDLTNRNKRQRFEKMFEFAPKGWVYARRIGREMHVKESEVRIVAESHKSSHEEWFKRYLTPTDILVTHYHPRLVTILRKHFDPLLRKKVTAEEYAEQTATTDARATELLEAADESALVKATRFPDTAFYSLEEHSAIIKAELDQAHKHRCAVIEDAETIFWEENDLSDEEKESTYWNSFEDSTESDEEFTSAEEDAPKESFEGLEIEMVPFNDDIHIPLLCLKPREMPLSEGMRKKVHEWLTLLPPRYAQAIDEIVFKENSGKEIEDTFGMTRSAVYFKVQRALRLLRTRKWLLFMWDYEEVSDDLLASICPLKETELYAISPEAWKKIRKMELAYFGNPSWTPLDPTR